MTAAQTATSRRTRPRLRLLVLLLVAAGLLVFLGANAHLFYVAFDSQPGCVEHAKTGAAEPGRFAAAQSAC